MNDEKVKANCVWPGYVELSTIQPLDELITSLQQNEYLKSHGVKAEYVTECKDELKITSPINNIYHLKRIDDKFLDEIKQLGNRVGGFGKILSIPKLV